MMIRKPAVAGSFYPANPSKIDKMFRDFVSEEQEHIDYSLARKNILGGIVPHAGYMYSGYEAVHFYEILGRSNQTFDTVVILNPNHTGYGSGDVNVDENQFWETPYGEVEVDVDFVRTLNLPVDRIAHAYEHSGEVQVPFLQKFLGDDFRIVPISLNQQTPDCARKVAKAIYRTQLELERKVLVIASSDFSHYVEPQLGKRLDDLVIDAILRLDVNGIYRVVKDKNISVCGYGPIMTLVECARLLSDEPKVKMLRKGNSGEVSPSPSVVDYVSMLFYEE